MRASTLAQRTFFASRAPGLRADLFTLEPADGSAHRWTSADVSITVGGHTYLAQSPNLELVSLTVRNTTEVPTLELKLSALDNDFAGGANIKLAIHQGDFDGARLRYQMLPMPAAGDLSLAPPIPLFDGRIGQIDVSATGATLKVRGDVVIMNQYAPRNIFQSSCQHRFCDPGCTLSEATFTTFDCAIAAGSTMTTIFWGGNRPADQGLLKFGKATFTTGANAGQRRSITLGNAAGFIIDYPLWFVPAVGDLVDVFLGCDKLLATCTNTYNNRAHYRGYPSVPDASYAA